MSDRREDKRIDNEAQERNDPNVAYTKLLLQGVGARRRAQLEALDPNVQTIITYCQQQAESGNASRRRAYAILWQHIADIQPSVPELKSTLRAWMGFNQQQAQLLRREGRFSPAEDLERGAKVYQEVGQRLEQRAHPCIFVD